jgi:hypothetical protein
MQRELTVNGTHFLVEFTPSNASGWMANMIETNTDVVLEQLASILFNVNKDNIEEYNAGASWCSIAIKEESNA